MKALGWIKNNWVGLLIGHTVGYFLGCFVTGLMIGLGAL